MTEAFLQYVWHHRLLEGPLATTEGLSVVVERPGELNRDAGPDFFDARVSIDGIHWAGNVEIHVCASDWKHHGHSADKAYNNVILHVVYVNDADIVLENGKKVPTLDISQSLPQHVWENYDRLMKASEDCQIPCGTRLKEIPDFLYNLSQDRLLIERIERKSGDVERILKESKGSWEQACYWLTAHYFGGKTNALPFELLAKVTPMRVVSKIKDNPFRIEALYFGQAGLLECEFNEEYPKSLQREYNYLRTAHQLSPIGEHLWKFFRVRPSSFPTLRISQFANLIAQSGNLFSRLLMAEDVKTIQKLFKVQTSEYWTTHYNFDKLSDASPKALGKSVIDTIIINSWIPLLFEYGVSHDAETYKERAFSLLQQMPSEDNCITRIWAEYGVKPHNAAESQSVIQRYTEYCSHKKCLDCQLAFRLLKTKS
ncbi:MAG: DUF2851 family protein [Bacteroidales bacterium]|nr:DUF2851 family protein [Bacteroidales bacterium]